MHNPQDHEQYLDWCSACWPSGFQNHCSVTTLWPSRDDQPGRAEPCQDSVVLQAKYPNRSVHTGYACAKHVEFLVGVGQYDAYWYIN
jgi:hypothetical protein